MAFKRNLSEGWRLTDGILPETLMEKPSGVYEALRDAGRLPDAEEGMNALSCEWIQARKWTYSLMLEAPGEDDERVFLELPKVSGRGEVFLNGEAVGDFESGYVRLELTGALNQDEENRIEICFEPALHARPGRKSPVPQIGLMAAPAIRTINYAAVEGTKLISFMDGKTGVICAEMTVQAYTAGRYTFRYALSVDGETAGIHEFTEKLPAARRTLKHEIRMPGAAALDLNRLEETVCGIKFTLERGGIGCDVRHMETGFRRHTGPARCIAAEEWPVSQDTIDRIIEAGADSVMLLGAPDNLPDRNDFLSGLTVIGRGEYLETAGMLRAEAMKKYAAGEAFWPADGALWKLRGGLCPEDTFGAEADRFARAMRCRQAQEVFLAAAKQRRRRGDFAVKLDEPYAYLASGALAEKSGAARPALGALRRAWQEAYVCCELPEGTSKRDAMIQMNVWAMAESLRGGILTASVRVMTLEGEELAAETFPVMGGDIRLIGMISVRTPDRDSLLIVRTELSERGDANGRAGRQLSRLDLMIPVGGDYTELLTTCPDAAPGQEKGAAAVSAGLCVLPGEDMPCGGEWVNR